MAALPLVALEVFQCLLPAELKVYDVCVWARALCSCTSTGSCQQARS
jgi:hypothetical protein